MTACCRVVWLPCALCQVKFLRIQGQWTGLPPFPGQEGSPALRTLQQEGSSCAGKCVSWEGPLSNNCRGSGAERLHLDWSKSTQAASTLNNFGAEHKPKGRQASINIELFHSIASKWRSAGCTGMSLNALWTSIFANSWPGPRVIIFSIASSTEIYDIEQRCFGITSLTLFAAGWKRSTISCHLFSWWALGITPKRLICASGIVIWLDGSITRPVFCSFAKYSSTTSRCSTADCIFLLEDLRLSEVGL